MDSARESDLIDVKVVSPSAHRPAEKKFPRTVTLREVKAFAVKEFGFEEGSQGGNQVIYFLYHEETKLENLELTIEAIVGPTAKKVVFRLVKEIIAG